MPAKSVLADNLFTISGILSPEECARLVERGEAIGFELAAVRTATGPKLRTDIRDNDRAEFADAALANLLWERCCPFVPYSLDGGTPIGMDDGFRFYRYEAGQRFNAHKDGVVVRSPLIRSRLTCLFYLNEDFEGGETVYYAPDRVDGVRPVVASVIPQTGMAVIFQHEWWHEGRGVRTGRKYVLRSDVFYRFSNGGDTNTGS